MSRLDAPLPGLLFRKGARRDLAEAFESIARNNPQRAWRFVDAVEETATLLLEYPKMGSPRAFADVPIRDLRQFPVKDFKMYLIYYQPLASGDGIEVVRVLHHKRDAQTLLADEPTDDAPQAESLTE